MTVVKKSIFPGCFFVFFFSFGNNLFFYKVVFFHSLEIKFTNNIFKILDIYLNICLFYFISLFSYKIPKHFSGNEKGGHCLVLITF